MTRKLTFGMMFLAAILAMDCTIVASQSYDFFFFVQQWPRSLRNSARTCCRPTTGWPVANFSIHGLWPEVYTGPTPLPKVGTPSTFDINQIRTLVPRLRASWPSLRCPSSDGSSFWEYEWDKHGIISKSQLDQRGYFEANLKLKDKVNILQILENAGIKADNSLYTTQNIKATIDRAVGFSTFPRCIQHKLRKVDQLLEVAICVEHSGVNFINCPKPPTGSICGPNVLFPKN